MGKDEEGDAFAIKDAEGKHCMCAYEDSCTFSLSAFIRQSMSSRMNVHVIPVAIRVGVCTLFMSQMQLVYSFSRDKNVSFLELSTCVDDEI